MIAALFVQRRGIYAGLPGVDLWDEQRDARTYAGPWPVVAHPPCARWGRYHAGFPGQDPPLKLGDDDGCFAAALAAVRTYGGVLEHPEGSHAWRHFELNVPPRCGGWVVADWDGGWTCCVEQGWYGHRARKATWLYAFGTDCPSLQWGTAPGDFIRFKGGTKEELARAIKTGSCQRLSRNQREATPVDFRDTLIMIAESANRRTHASSDIPR